MKNHFHAPGFAMAALLALVATAARPQPPPVATQLSYRSAFADYKPYKEPALANWREVNDTVARTPGGGSGLAATPAPGPASMPIPTPMKPEPPAPMPAGQHPHGGRP